MNKKSQNFSVIVPFFNEENTLKIAINDLIKQNFVKEIILLNDGSTDSSKKIATELAQKNRFIKLVNNETNRGKGYSVKVGIRHSTGDIVGIFDADLEYSAADLKKLLKSFIEMEHEIVCGSRFLGHETRQNIYLRTYLANKFLSLLFSVTYGRKVTDVATCLKVFSKEIITNLELESEGFTIEIELLAKALLRTQKFSEYPISYKGRSYKEGKKIKFIDGFRFIRSIYKYK